MLAYWGKKRKLIEIVNIVNGVVTCYYGTGQDAGSMYLPLIENGKNVEEFEIIENEQLSFLEP